MTESQYPFQPHFSKRGSVLTPQQQEELHQRRGECLTCGQQCFRRSLWKKSLTIEGKVEKGRCLKCHPLHDASTTSTSNRTRITPPSPMSRQPTEKERASFEESIRRQRVSRISSEDAVASPYDMNEQERDLPPLEISILSCAHTGKEGSTAEYRIQSTDVLVPEDEEWYLDYEEDYDDNPDQAEDNIERLYRHLHNLSQSRPLRQPSRESRVLVTEGGSDPVLINIMNLVRHASRNHANTSSSNKMTMTSNSSSPSAETSQLQETSSYRSLLGTSGGGCPLSPPTRVMTPTSIIQPSPSPSSLGEDPPAMDVSELEILLANLSAAGNVDTICDSLVGTMRLNCKIVAIQLFCFRTIRNLCRDRHEYRASLIETSAPEDILLSMQTHIDNAEIQELGCEALWSLSMNHHNRFIVIRAGAIARNVKTVKEYRENQEVIQSAFACLRILSPEPKVRECMGVLDGIRHVCEAMSTHLAVVCIQRDGCVILSNTAVDLDEQQVAIASTSELEVIIKALVVHKSNSSVVSVALLALKNYAYDSRNSRTLLTIDSAVTSIQDACHSCEDTYLRRDASIVLDRALNCSAIM
jgi:hypothetical protein